MEIPVCLNCNHFKPNKAKGHFAGGWWIGDGKCSAKNTDFKFTVEMNSCGKHIEIDKIQEELDWDIQFREECIDHSLENDHRRELGLPCM